MNRVTTLFAAVIATGTLAACKSDKPKETAAAPEPVVAEQAPPPAPPLTREDVVMVYGSGTVKAIDQSSRIMTLQDSGGDEVTVWVDPSVKRLNEVRVGDVVRAQFKARLLAELRPPTADEAAMPRAVIGSGESTRVDGDPVGTRSRALRVVTTVEAVDVPRMLVTLRDPRGETATVKGRNPDNVRRLKVGDTIVITYTESVAVALDKVGR